MAIASLVLGILGLVFLWVPFLGVVIAVVGLVLGVLGKKQLDTAGKPSGAAVAGIVMSIIALVFATFYTAVCWVCSGACTVCSLL